jgi:iron(III) transport system permease protein
VLVRSQFPLRRPLELIAWLPWALPGIVLSLAMLWAYIRLPIPIYGTIWVLLLAYVTSGLPLGVRTMSGVLSQVSADLEESARSAGASWRQCFVDIVIALVRPGFVAGWFLLGFLFMRQLSIAVMLYGSGSEVLSMLSFRAWELGNGGQAVAIASVTLAMMLALLLADFSLRRWERRRTEQRARLAPPTTRPTEGVLAT